MSLIHNERTKLTASYLNGAAAAFFAAGVVAPVAAAVFGFAGAGSPVSTLTIGTGISIFFLVSVGAHLAARYVLKDLRP